MKKEIFTFFFASLLAAGALQAYAQQPETQKSMNKEASMRLQHADDSLQHIYDQLLQDFADQPKFIKWLTKSQKLWKELREANMNMQFPKKDDPTYYGSVFPMCYSLMMTNHTHQRIRFLNQWIEGIPEGDVCTGSIPFKKE